MPPKIDLPPTSGRSSPVLPSTPARIGTPTNGAAAAVPTPRAQQAPADTTMPTSRPPSRPNSTAASTPQRPRTPTSLASQAASSKPDAAPPDGAKPAVASAAKEGAASAATPEIEQQVVAARTEMALKRKSSLEQVLSDPESAVRLTTAERDVISAMDHFIETGRTSEPATSTHGTQRPGGELAQQIRQDASGFLQHTPARGNSAAASCARAGATIVGLMKRVAANEDFGFTGSVAASVANVTALNLVKVWGPTLVRQYISYGIEAGLEATHAGPTARAVLGAVPAVASAAIEVAGAIRDHRAGTGTVVSHTSRAVMGGMALAGAGTALGTGAMAGVAALPVAFKLYCAMRDLGPGVAWKAVDRNAVDKGFGHWLMHTVQYGLNQALNNHLMSTHASPSGAGAFQAGAGLQHGNNAKRAGINTFFENIDDLASPAMDMIKSAMDPNQQTLPMQIGLKNVGFSKDNYLNALTLFATRTSATSQGLTFGGSANELIAKDKQALALLANDVILGLVNGPEYFHFSNTLAGQPPGTDRHAAIEDVETARAQPVGREAPIELPQTVQPRQAQPSPTA
jgi:hypothetical protein